MACADSAEEELRKPPTMSKTREEVDEERRRLKVAYGELFDAVTALLFRHDPVGINLEDNTDEYEAEAGTILPRLNGCQSEVEVLQVVHEEFCHWFGVETAGTKKRYAAIASEIWQLWRKAHPDQP